MNPWKFEIYFLFIGFSWLSISECLWTSGQFFEFKLSACASFFDSTSRCFSWKRAAGVDTFDTFLCKKKKHILRNILVKLTTPFSRCKGNLFFGAQNWTLENSKYIFCSLVSHGYPYLNVFEPVVNSLSLNYPLVHLFLIAQVDVFPESGPRVWILLTHSSVKKKTYFEKYFSQTCCLVQEIYFWEQKIQSLKIRNIFFVHWFLMVIHIWMSLNQWPILWV